MTTPLIRAMVKTAHERLRRAIGQRARKAHKLLRIRADLAREQIAPRRNAP